MTLRDGTADLFVWYDCSDKTVRPCGDSVSLELVTLGKTAAVEAGSSYSVFDPDNVVVQVPDPSGRTTSSDSGNSGALVWSTGHPNFTNLPGGRDRPGVVLVEDLLLDSETTEDPDQWSGPSDGTIGTLKVEASGPGQLSTWYQDGANPAGMYGSATDGVLYDGEWWEGRAPLYAEFGALGTYNLTMTIKSIYDDDTTDMTAGVEYSDTGIYTFHVGPIQDLEVLAGSSASDVATGRTAYTILAANSGPENSVDATVKIELPSGTQVEDYVASEGTYANGVWNLPGLEMRDSRRSRGKVGEASLTLVLKEGGGVPKEAATATINLTDNSYKVCIGRYRRTLAHTTQATCESVTGASWHEGTVYEYPNNNNEAKISAQQGGGVSGVSGGPPPGSPGMGGAKTNSRSVTLTWGAVQSVNTLALGHYEVQKYIRDEGRETWQTVSGPVPDTQWTDFNVGSGAIPPYRVRAVNAAGYGGPWSATFNRPTAQQQGQLAAPALTARTADLDAIRLTWTAPSNQQGAITGYELDYLAGDTWTILYRPAASETEYLDSGLSPGTERSYRVRAMSSDGPGRWSRKQTAWTEPGLPTLFKAEPNGPNAILITWDPGSSVVSRFELEVSTDGSSFSRLTSPSGTARSYTHNTGPLDSEVRYYRLRACNAAGCGEWATGANATTAPRGAPAAPGLTARASSASEIRLSWSARADADGYQLQHSTGGGYWDDLPLSDPLDTEFAHQADFGGGTTQYYRVRAWSEENGTNLYSAWSAVRSVTIAAGLPGQPALSFITAASTDDSLTLTWTEPVTNGSRITGYRVERNDRGNSGQDNYVRIGSTGSSVTTYTDRNLYSGELYCYRVVAASNVGTGAYSDEQCASTTGPYARDPEPPIARLSSVSPHRVTIAWDPPADDGGRPVQSYLYQQAEAGRQF